MKLLLVIAGVLAAIFAGALSLFTIGEIPAVLVLIVIVAAVAYALTAGLRFLSFIALSLGIIFVGAIAYGAYSAYSVYDALASTDGPVDPADPVALASGNAKIDAAEETAGFRIEMTQAELTAVLQDAMADNTDNPLRRVDLTVIDGSNDEQGHIDFSGKFKNGGVEANGSVTAKVDAGRIQFSVTSVDLGNFSVPGLARSAVSDLVETITDLNKRLREHNADVQSLQIGGGKVVVVGVQGGGDLVTLDTLLGGLKENIAALGTKAQPPAEVIGTGEVNGISAEGARYYVAIGDSLAANVGVKSASDGYVSRFLKAIAAQDHEQYGLRDFGVPGETSSGLINNGQLDQAIAFMKGADVAYVTVDIGANDLLGHLFSDDCKDDLATPACKARLDSTTALYGPNLDTIISRLIAAAPRAKIIFLGMYNPFSIGFGSAVGLEAQSDAIVDQVNGLAKAAAAKHGIQFADGQAAIQGRAGAVTHMLDQTPDIHPLAIGYDLLAQQLVLVAAK